MQKIQWSDLPEARQLASLGKKVSRPAQGRLQWMLFYYFNGRNAARTCRRFGISRQTFYRWKRRFDRHDLTTLGGRSHRPRQLRKPTWSAELVERVLALRKQYPRWGKDKLVVLLRKKTVHRFYFDGRAHPGATQTARGVARATETRRVAAGTTETAESSMGYSQA